MLSRFLAVATLVVLAARATSAVVDFRFCMHSDYQCNTLENCDDYRCDETCRKFPDNGTPLIYFRCLQNTTLSRVEIYTHMDIGCVYDSAYEPLYHYTCGESPTFGDCDRFAFYDVKFARFSCNGTAITTPPSAAPSAQVPSSAPTRAPSTAQSNNAEASGATRLVVHQTQCAAILFALHVVYHCWRFKV